MPSNTSSDDALIFQANQAPDDFDTSPDTEDPNSVNREPHHNYHERHKFDYPRRAEESCLPLPSAPLARIPEDPKRLNGTRLTGATRARDRDMLEY
jgi:hypothetical protein